MRRAARSLQHQCVAPGNVRLPDALMAIQITRERRPTMCRQIIRCRHEQTPRLAEGPQLHGAVGERAQAKRDVDALPDKVDALVGETEVDPDVGIAVLKREDQPADVQDAESRRAGYPYRTCSGAARSPRLIPRL